LHEVLYMAKNKKKKKKTSPQRLRTMRTPHLSVCRGSLSLAFLMMVAYAVIMMGIAVWQWEGLAKGTVVLWGITQMVMGYAVICLYRHQRAARWGAVGALLILSGVLTMFPTSDFLSQALQALAVAGFSLVLYDLQKYIGVPLMLPGGLIFLAVIAQIVSSPLMAFFGLAFLAMGAGLGLARM